MIGRLRLLRSEGEQVKTEEDLRNQRAFPNMELSLKSEG